MSMSVSRVRVFAVFILLSIILSKQYQLLYYYPVMFISLEYLNSNKQYISAYNYKLLNALFVGYVLLICIDRSRPYKFYDGIEIIINSFEHLLFGFIICIKMAVYYSIFQNKLTLQKNERLGIVIVFNIFGFLNEFFQNWYKHQSQWHLNFDSRKDILMNIIGTLLFYFLFEKINRMVHLKNSYKL